MEVPSDPEGSTAEVQTVTLPVPCTAALGGVCPAELWFGTPALEYRHPNVLAVYI